MTGPKKKQLLQDITEAAKPLGWSEVEVQRLIGLTNEMLVKLLAVFRRAANGTNREDRVSNMEPRIR
jgi:hypothetical protein